MVKGSKITEEHRRKLSLAKKGKPSPNRDNKTPESVREKISRSLLAYFESANPGLVISDDRKRIRRERIKKYGGAHSIGEWETLKAQYNWTCPACSRAEPEIKLTRDHIVAVAKGGSDNIENIQPLCVSCNSRKGTKSINYITNK